MGNKFALATSTGFVAIVLGLALSEPSTAILYRALLFGWAALLFISRIVFMEVIGARYLLDRSGLHVRFDVNRADPYRHMPSLV